MVLFDGVFCFSSSWCGGLYGRRHNQRGCGLVPVPHASCPSDGRGGRERRGRRRQSRTLLLCFCFLFGRTGRGVLRLVPVYPWQRGGRRLQQFHLLAQISVDLFQLCILGFSRFTAALVVGKGRRSSGGPVPS